MDLHKAASLANIGSFFLGVAMLWLAWAHQLSPAAIQSAVPNRLPVSIWIFAAVLLLAALLNLIAARMHLRPPETAIKTPVSPSKHAPPGDDAKVQARTPTPQTTIPGTLTSFQEKPSPQTPPPTQPERIFVGPDATPQTLVAPFEKMTSIQASLLTQAYIGKWMELRGKLDDIGISGSESGELHVSVLKEGEDSTSILPFVHLYFKPQWRDRLSILNVGNVVKVHGKITSIHASQIRLKECELAP